jgi:lycopene cyclase domain-containing protein
MSLYAWLMLGSLAGPLLLSFDKKVSFYKWWPALFAGIIVNGVFFILWDSWFTREGIWSFNPQYVADYRWLLLPLEEWSFFIVIPYCSIFIYACCKAYLKDDFFRKISAKLNWFALILLAFTILIYHAHRYTFYNSIFAFLLLLFHQFYLKKNYLGYFWMAYFIHLIPFFIVNGVLTAKPVVIYNSLEIIGPRFYTIPIEDSIYALTCLLLPITVMEYIFQIKNQASKTALI